MVSWSYFLVVSISLLGLYRLLKHLKTQLRIWRWKKNLNLDRHQSVHDALYAGINGFTLSQAARVHHDAMDYVYGEIKFLPFIALLSLLDINSETVFYDLGSGTGKAVLACGMSFRVKKSCGIELFKSLHEAACEGLNQLKKLEGYNNKASTICFYQGDFLHHDLSEATLIFINASAFFGETWNQLNKKIDKLTQCQTLVSSKMLQSTCYQVIKRTCVEMSWGPVIVYIHERIRH